MVEVWVGCENFQVQVSTGAKNIVNNFAKKNVIKFAASTFEALLK